MRRCKVSLARRRIMDKAVRHLKYNDGVKDILNKIKSKVSELVTKIKDSPKGRTIVSLLYGALAAANAIYAAHGIAELKRNTKELHDLNRELSRYIGRDFDYYKEQEKKVLTSSLMLVLNLFVAFESAVFAKLAIANKQVAEGEDESRVVAEVMTR